MSTRAQNQNKARPFINVTPLIDVLLVMLIIFMVVTPLRPSRFTAQLPSPPDDHPVAPDPQTLVVIIAPDHTLKLNEIGDLGTIEDPGKLTAKLSAVLRERDENHAYSYAMRDRVELPEAARIQKTVFIRAPRSLTYGAVVRVIDGIKGAGARPIGLQLDGLN